MPGKWTDPDLYADHASKSKCGRCGASVIKARAGLVMALDVRVDPEPVLDDRWVLGTDRMLWCRRGKRMMWHDHKRCGNVVYADHACDEGDVYESGLDSAVLPVGVAHIPVVIDHQGQAEEPLSTEDPFGIDEAPKNKKPASPYVGTIHPVTGKLIGRHARVTNFIKGIADDFGLQLWMRRVMIRGVVNNQDLIEELQTLDVSRDSVRIDAICAQAKAEAGGDDASKLGTKLHTQTEYADREEWDRIDDEHRGRMEEYREAVAEAGLTIIPMLIERRIVHLGLGPSPVVGTFDRIVRTADGDHVILDVKTGSLDPDKFLEKWLEMAAQMEIYQDAVNTHGVYHPVRRNWTRVPPVNREYGIIAHLPAKGEGCRLYTVDLAEGRAVLAALQELRQKRKAKGFVRAYERPATVDVDVSKLVEGMQERAASKRSGVTSSDDFPFLIDTALTKSALLDLMGKAKLLNCWNADLASHCKARLEVINSRA